MDIVPFIQLPLEIGNSDHDSEVLPHVGVVQLESFPDGARGAELGARDLAIFDLQYALAFQAVEVLGEGTAEVAEVVAFDDEGE